MKDQEFSDKTARKTLKELLKVCEAHGISKEGFIEEIQEGLDPEKDTGQVITGGNKRVISLDLEKVAMRGQERINLNLDEKHSQAPRKLTEHDLQTIER